MKTKEVYKDEWMSSVREDEWAMVAMLSILMGIIRIIILYFIINNMNDKISNCIHVMSHCVFQRLDINYVLLYNCVYKHVRG